MREPAQDTINEYLKDLIDSSAVRSRVIFAVFLVFMFLAISFTLGREISRRLGREQLPDKSKQSLQQEQLPKKFNQLYK